MIPQTASPPPAGVFSLRKIPMDPEHLLTLFRDTESDRVERKASAGKSDLISQAICAFANDLPDQRQPGVVFIGVNDDGSCANLVITDELLRNLADLRSNGNIHPFPTLTVQKHTLDGCEVAVIAVEPADAPPVRYKGRVYIRVGPRRAIASQEEERRLAEKRRARDLPFDVQPVSSATIGDLDLDLFERTYLPASISSEDLEANQRTRTEQLASLRLATPDGLLTVLGLLVLGQDLRRFLPGAYIQFLRFDGEELTSPIRHQQEIDGPLPDQLRLLDEVLEANISIGTEVVGHTTEVQQPDYPLTALQQLARNAVLHRTYEGTHAPVHLYWFSDRIEITSPGGVYGQVTRERFGEPGLVDYRNPHLAEALKNLGYVQRFGLGIPLAQQELTRNGNPAAEFRIEDSRVLVTLRRRS